MTAATGVREALTNPMLHVDPSTLGKVVTKVDKTVTTTESDVQKEAIAIDQSTVTTKINSIDKTATITFGSRTGWSYQYQLDNGAWITISSTTVNPQSTQVKAQTTNSTISFTTPRLIDGTHIISLREVNPQNNKPGIAITLP